MYQYAGNKNAAISICGTVKLHYNIPYIKADRFTEVAFHDKHFDLSTQK